MKRYPEYIDSGIEWFGNTPPHWTHIRIKTLIESEVNGVWGDEPVGDENDLICVRVADFDIERFGVNGGNLTFRNIPLVQQKGRTLSRNTLLIEKSGGGEKNPVGRVVRYNLEHKSVCSNFIAKLEATKEVLPQYMVFLFNYLYSNGVNTRSIKQTTGIQNLDTKLFFNERVFLPPISEQSRLVDFIENMLCRINDLIDKKQKLIELLKEERTAMINQAVTKGIDPTVPMKDSGIEWLGEIPKHWEITQISNIAEKLTNGYVGPTRDILKSTGVRYLQSLHIKDNRIIFHTEYYVDENWSNQHARSILKEEDILIVQTGDIGQTSVVPKEFEGCNCHALIIITPKKSISGFYLAELLNSNYGYHKLKSIQKGALHPHLNSGDVRYIEILQPPIDEQNKVVSYLDKINHDIDRTLKILVSEIKLLHEYKTSLINEAVTGKIDVRDYQIDHA